jgi:SNF2 family DNA or RNA helicase
LKRDITAYDGLYFSSVILDEAQYIKNHKTAIAKAVKILQADHRFALTGTPIENRISELWSIFDFLMPGFLYTSSEFAERFETPIMKKKDPAATARLSRMTEPFILRRKKTDVLKDLPEKLEEVHTSLMEDDQRKLYDAHVVHMKEILSSSGNSGEDKMRVLAEITRLRQLCCDPSLLFEDYKGSSTKRAACLELIQNAIDGGHRMLVFSQFTSMLRYCSRT